VSPDYSRSARATLSGVFSPAIRRWWCWPYGCGASATGRPPAGSTGSHVGLIFNRKSYRAITAALAVPELAVDHPSI
jgi:hypothetical protein